MNWHNVQCSTLLKLILLTSGHWSVFIHYQPQGWRLSASSMTWIQTQLEAWGTWSVAPSKTRGQRNVCLLPLIRRDFEPPSKSTSVGDCNKPNIFSFVEWKASKRWFLKFYEAFRFGGNRKTRKHQCFSPSGLPAPHCLSSSSLLPPPFVPLSFPSFHKLVVSESRL